MRNGWNGCFGKANIHGRRGAIFFDGALPASKTETRIGRLDAYAAKLKTYHRVHGDQLRLGRSHTQETGADDVWRTGELRRARRELAPPGFLVSAVLEALIDSQYGDRTFVVPDEADRFCVAAARKACLDDSGMGIAIFADDSDLFVFNSGPGTRIIPLKDLGQRREGDAQVLTGVEVWPAETARDLHVPDLIELAFWLSQHSNISVREAMAHIVPGQAPTQYEYVEFAKLYRLNRHEETLDVLQRNPSHRQPLAGLDARVSELVQKARHHEGRSGPICFDMFLPFLLEDPTRSSAWRVGTGLRLIAYELLLIATGLYTAEINEWKRAANHINAYRIQDWSFQTLNARLKDLSILFGSAFDSSAAEKEEELTLVEQWKFVAMKLVLWHYQDEGWMIPLPAEIALVLAGQPFRRWELVHLSARYQAAFYSLRILFQVLRYVRRIDGGGPQRVRGLQDPNSTPNVLLRQLEGLPNIAVFFGKEDGTARKAEVKWTPWIEAHFVVLGEALHPPRVEKKKKKTVKKESGAKGVVQMPRVQEEEEEEGPLAGNPFAALAAE